MKQVPWSAAELAVLAEVYPVKGALGCMALLPGRTIDAIRQRSHKNNIFVLPDALHEIQTAQHSGDALPGGARSFKLAPFDAVSTRWALLRAGLFAVQPEGESHG